MIKLKPARPVKSRLYCIHFPAVLTSNVSLFLGARVYFVKKTGQIPVLTFLKYRYFTGPGIAFSIPNWKHYVLLYMLSGALVELPTEI
jgi:hypothetical protein